MFNNVTIRRRHKLFLIEKFLKLMISFYTADVKFIHHQLNYNKFMNATVYF